MKFNLNYSLIKNQFIYILILLLAFHTIFNLNWLQAGYVPLSDEAYYFLYSVKIFKTFPNNFLATALSIHPSRPTLFPLTTLPFYLLIGPSLLSSIITQLLFFAILLFSTYKIGEKIYDKNIGIISAIVVSMFPAIFTFSRLFYLEFPLAAMIALSIYLLLLTDLFKNKKYSFLFGISLGLAALTKSSFIIFLFGPIFFTFIKILKPFKKLQFINFVITITIAFSIASILYLPNLHSILYWHIKNYTDPKIWTSEYSNLLTYLLPFFHLSKIMSIPYFIFFLLSLIYILKDFRRKQTDGNVLILLSSMIFSFLFFIFFPVKGIRHIIPLLPIVAILLVYPISKLQKFRNMWGVLLILTGLIIFLFNYKYPILLEGRGYDTKLKLKESEIREIINFLSKTKEKINLGVFNIHLMPTIELYAEIENVRIIPHLVYEGNNSVYQTVLENDYLLIAEDWESGAKSKGLLKETSEVVEMLEKNMEPISNYFKLVKKINTSSGTILIYQKIREL